MQIAYVIVTLLTAAWVGFSAFAIFTRMQFVVGPLTRYGVPESWWPWLATAKSAGAAGLVIGLLVPPLGTLAAVCLVLYFTGAEITVLRARAWSHIVSPLAYMVPLAAVLILGAQV